MVGTALLSRHAWHMLHLVQSTEVFTSARSEPAKQHMVRLLTFATAVGAHDQGRTRGSAGRMRPLGSRIALMSRKISLLLRLRLSDT